jgi:hypothetical protein
MQGKKKKGWEYTLDAKAIEELKGTPTFIENFRLGVKLLCLSLGFDLESRTFVPKLEPNQGWQSYPVRLYKAGLSCFVLGQEDLFHGMKVFAEELERQGKNLEFHSTPHRKIIHCLKQWHYRESK